MEILRYARDAWGQKTLAGLSFDLVWVAIGLGALLIVLHLGYRYVCARRQRAASAGAGAP